MCFISKLLAFGSSVLLMLFATEDSCKEFGTLPFFDFLFFLFLLFGFTSGSSSSSPTGLFAGPFISSLI